MRVLPRSQGCGHQSKFPREGRFTSSSLPRSPAYSLTEDELVDLPVLEVLLEDEGAHVRVEVEHAGAVDVQDGVEAVPVPVEEELCPPARQTVEVVTSFNVNVIRNDPSDPARHFEIWQSGGGHFFSLPRKFRLP